MLFRYGRSFTRTALPITSVGGLSMEVCRSASSDVVWVLCSSTMFSRLLTFSFKSLYNSVRLLKFVFISFSTGNSTFTTASIITCTVLVVYIVSSIHTYDTLPNKVMYSETSLK